MRLGFPALAFPVTACLALSTAVLGEPPVASPKKEGKVELFSPARIKWQEGPPSLPKGALMAILEGDPAKEGPFVFRVKLPDGYRIPPHTHPKTERITVLSGKFHIGMGDKFDEKTGNTMTVGTYGYWPAGMSHFVWTKGETILQFHGRGPWSIQYVNPKDDPRNQKE